MPSKNDIKFGEFAVQHNYITASKVKECLLRQGELEKQGRATCIEHVIHEKGYMTEEQIEAVGKQIGRRIHFCPQCMAKLNVAGIDIGAGVRCPKCDSRLTVPASVLPKRAGRLEGYSQLSIAPSDEELRTEEGQITEELLVELSEEVVTKPRTNEEWNKADVRGEKHENLSEGKKTLPKGRFDRIKKYRK